VPATLLAVAGCTASPSTTSPSATSALVTATSRDGHQDFDPLLGTWRTHYRMLRKRLVNSQDWYSCEGDSVVRPFWGGTGDLEARGVRCPDRTIGGVPVRTYSDESHQWSLWWGTRKLGLVPPPQVGHFDGKGTGEFLADDTWEGKPIVCRYK